MTTKLQKHLQIHANLWWLQNKKKGSKWISQYTCSLNEENQIVIQQARRNRVKNIARHNF